MRAMETVGDLIEELKLRTVWWGVCVFAISYFLTHTSKSMWTNIPMSIIILAFLRYLSFKVEIHWRVQPVRKQTHLPQLAKKQLSANDYRLSTRPPVSRWRQKVDSPSVEAALESFIENILRDFVVDLWYSSITPDREAAELIRSLMLDALGELSTRMKKMNLIDLLTRDMVDLIGNHLEIYRRNQSRIGVDVMGSLSFEERDERLKQHLIASNELHPALLSSEHEYKVLQQIVGGVTALVLRPQEAQSQLVRCFCRELLTCLVLQPVMTLASPSYINEIIMYLLNNHDMSGGGANADKSHNAVYASHDHSVSKGDSQGSGRESRNSSTQSIDFRQEKSNGIRPLSTYKSDKPEVTKNARENSVQPRQPDWAVVLDAATKRRTQVLAPENLENMWTRGRHYQKKMMKVENSSGVRNPGGVDNVPNPGTAGMELSPNFNERIACMDDRYMVNLMHGSSRNAQYTSVTDSGPHVLQTSAGPKPEERTQLGDDSQETLSKPINSRKVQLKRSNSTPDMDTRFGDKNGQTMVSQENLNAGKNKDEQNSRAASHGEVLFFVPKIRCRVVGAYFEKHGSKSFAVYSIAVTDADNKTWFVKRRYRNFERLHRQLKEIPNYSLHLPPKSFLASSIDDYLVHQRCILLDKYLQDLLSIANIAEQHEVWDFLSATSKNYSSGKSTSVIKTLAVNVDDAMDDIVRQFKGVSDGLKRKVVGTSPSSAPSSQLAENRMALSWNAEESDKHSLHYRNLETANCLSDDDSNYEDRASSVNSGWHSDNEMNTRGYSSHAVEHIEASSSLDFQRSPQGEKPTRANSDSLNMSSSLDPFEGAAGIPPEWTPTNVSVPLLNLVDKVFQLKRRGWLRRQVLWISKQILQLVMEDAIDDWILRQINWLRKDDVIAQGICWMQDTLWPNGTFFTRLDGYQGKIGECQFQSGCRNQPFGNTSTGSSSFELQLEASRRANEVKKLLLGGTPPALVSIIGSNQYRRSARDVYYFLQSTVCIKQLAYAMFEMVLVSVFPELHQLIEDIHEKGRKEQALFNCQV